MVVGGSVTSRAARTAAFRSALVVALVCVLLPTGAGATFPGSVGSLAFIRGGDLWVMSADGSDQTLLVDDRASGIFDPDWSADGSAVAYQQTGDIWVKRLGSSAPVNITNSTEPEADPAWAPDGNSIAFSKTVNGNMDVYRMDVDGTDLQRLTDDANSDGFATWSPDGASIAFGSNRRAGTGVHVMSATGDSETLVVATTTLNSYPDWSPDGSKIAYGSAADLNVVNADGTGQTQLTRNARAVFGFSWAPDGSKIAFGGGTAGDNEVNVVNADGTGLTNLSNSAATDDRLPDWATVATGPTPGAEPIGLVSHWKFDEGSGNTATDAIDSSNNDGRLQGDATFSNDVPTAVGTGTSLQLDGSGDHVEVPDAATLDFSGSDALTIAMWAKRRGTTPSVYHLFSKRSRCTAPPSGMNYQMGRDSRGVGFVSQTYELISSVPDLTLNEWTHLAVTYDPTSGGTARIYVDGADSGSLSPFVLGEENDFPLIIGGTAQIPGSTCINEPFPGLMDDVRIYERTLGDGEVADLARGETDTPPQCGDPGAVCGSSDSETIEGTPEDEFIYGGGGDDTIDGGGGDDVIVGGSGADTIVGAGGEDVLRGGDGDDVLVGDGATLPLPIRNGRASLRYSQNAEGGSADSLDGGAGNDLLDGGGGEDELKGGDGVDTVEGGSGNDSVAAGDQKDIVDGGGGNDKIKGQDGNDNLKGAAGNDVLNGGPAPVANTMNGGPGRDVCALGTKKDKTVSCEKKPPPPKVRGRPL